MSKLRTMSFQAIAHLLAAQTSWVWFQHWFSTSVPATPSLDVRLFFTVYLYLFLHSLLVSRKTSSSSWILLQTCAKFTNVLWSHLYRLSHQSLLRPSHQGKTGSARLKWRQEKTYWKVFNTLEVQRSLKMSTKSDQLTFWSYYLYNLKTQEVRDRRSKSSGFDVRSKIVFASSFILLLTLQMLFQKKKMFISFCQEILTGQWKTVYRVWLPYLVIK